MAENEKISVVEEQSQSVVGKTAIKIKNFGLKKTLAMLLIIVIVVAVVEGLAWHNRQAQSNKINNEIAQVQKKLLLSKDINYAKLSPEMKATYLLNSGYYAAAQKVYGDQIKSNTTVQTKLYIYSLQEGIAIDYKNYSDAQKYVNEAKNIASNSSVTYVMLAQLSEAEGNKQAAITYYQDAIHTVNPNNPAANLIKSSYQSNIIELKVAK